MRRKALDTLLTAGGLVVVVVLLVAGGLLMWGHNFANSNVHSQLVQQQITFPAKGSSSLASPEIGPYLNQYAGQMVTTGPQAKAYADHYIGVHLKEMPYGGVYAKVSAAAQAAPAGSAQATQLKALQTTVFQGTTLRGLLLEAYAFWEIGQIALIASIASFVLAGVMLIVTGLGVWHLRRVDPAQEFLPAAKATVGKPVIA